MDAYLEAGLGLNSAAWLARLFEGNYRCVERLVSEGFPLETGPEGKWTRRSGRGPMPERTLDRATEPRVTRP